VSIIVIDGLNEEDFRRSIENRLREGRVGAAIDRSRSLLAPYAGPEGILPERFLTVETSDLVLQGWAGLEDAIRRHDQPGRPVTALSIGFAWPGDEGPRPDVDGSLRPHVETSYFSDNAYPFSQSTREDLLDGYSYYGCTWSGDSDATDTVLSLEGIDDLYGALAVLEAQLLASDEPDEEGIRAGSLGAILLSAMLVNVVADRIAKDGLPRPICVMAGSSGVYPYFDVPVVGMPEAAIKKAEEDEQEFVEPGNGVPAPRYSSLLMTGIARAKKRAALVLDESAVDAAIRIAQLRGFDPSDGDSPDGPRNSDRLHPEFATAALIPAETEGKPLLARKPARKAAHLAGMIDLHEPYGIGAQSPLHEQVEAASSADRAGWPEEREAMLPDPESHLSRESIQSGEATAIADCPAIESGIKEDQPAFCMAGGTNGIEDDHELTPWQALRSKTISHAVHPDLRTRIIAWMRCKLEKWFARFGL